MKIAFAGNPNSGKTTMFNALTGRNEKVGNWAGVTVDRKEAPIKKIYTGELDLLAVDLPGMKKDEIHLELQNGYLTISTQKNLENKEEKHGKLLRQERYTGTMQRSFYVGDNLTEEDVQAKYEDGVLTVKLPKKEAKKVPEKKQILIG